MHHVLRLPHGPKFEEREQKKISVIIKRMNIIYIIYDDCNEYFSQINIALIDSIVSRIFVFAVKNLYSVFLQ